MVHTVLKKLFILVVVKVVDISLANSQCGKYLLLFTSTSVNNNNNKSKNWKTMRDTIETGKRVFQ